MRRLVSIRLALTALLLVSSIGGLGPAFAREAAPLSSDPALEARVMDLAEELRCLVCQNETIAASQADLAVGLRGEIRAKLQGGESKAQIVDFMVARYGEFVRYKPALAGTTLLLWLGPFMLLAAAAFVLVINIRRQRPAGLAVDASPVLEPEPQRSPRRGSQAERADDDTPAQARAMSKRTTIALTAAVPAVAACVYMLIGNPAAAISSPTPPSAVAEPTQKDMDAMLDVFAKAMDERPPGRFEDLEGWVMLARTYAATKRFPQAAAAFGKASALAPKDAQLLADWADVVAMQPGDKSAKDAAALVERALALNPSNLKALALAGSGAYQRKDFDAAIAWWTRARALAPPAGEFVAGLDMSIDEARAAASGVAKPRGDRLQP